jgi:hypothetical protein
LSPKETRNSQKMCGSPRQQGDDRVVVVERSAAARFRELLEKTSRDGVG